MPELRDQDLILYYYGEARNAAAVRRRLDASPADAERYDELCRLLELGGALPVPELDGDYGARVWQRIAPRLDEPRSRTGEWLAGLLAPRRLALAASMAMLLIAAFVAGRHWPADPGPEPLPAAGRERILLVSVGEHLERSEMWLIELANAPRDGGPELAEELRLAAELLPSNRLYRQAAKRSGQAQVADVLDELERLLLDVAHAGDLSPPELEDLQGRIAEGGLLFRVQVVGSRVQRRNPTNPPPETSGAV